MEKNHENYYYKEMPNHNFFVDIFEKKYTDSGVIFNAHWHEHIQFFYFIEGQALIRCNTKNINVSKNDFVIINSNELHSMESLCNNLDYYVIRVDFSFIFSNQIDSCQTKFMLPLANNLILFKNLVKDDCNIIECTNKIINEYFTEEIGFELAIKSFIYNLIVLLLRGYIEKIFTQNEFELRMNKLKNFNIVFDYIEKNYTKSLSIEELSEIVHVSSFHFCRLFKQITGKTAIDYINELRLAKAILLLQESRLNITEIALACGFNDANYFSRIFKKFKHISPSEFRKKVCLSHGAGYNKMSSSSSPFPLNVS